MNNDIDGPASAGAVALRETRAGRSVVFGIILTLTLIAGVMFLIYSSSRTATNANARVEHTRDVTVVLEETTAILKDMELADSRYLRTGLESYRSAREADFDAFSRHLGRLNVILADPTQHDRLATVQSVLNAMPWRLRSTDAPPVTPGYDSTETLSEQISVKLREMQGEESRLLSEQLTDLKRSINAQSFAFLGLLILASSALCTIYISVCGHIKRQREERNVLGIERLRAETESDPQILVMARAHFDIRSALTAILGYCDLPLEPETPAQNRFDSIRSQAVQIIAAVDTILNMPDIAEAPAPSPTVRASKTSHMVANCADTGALTPTPETATPAMQFSGRVLLAEDDLNIQRMIKYYLQSAGAEVTVVCDGQLACEQALLAWNEKKPFDLILMDVQMPKQDGCSATILLRNSQYTHPIVALTASATREERDRCFTAGCNGFLTKPINKAEFLKTLTRYLQPKVPVDDASSNSEFAAVHASPAAEAA